MNNWSSKPTRRTNEQLLAAYVDGELSSEDRAYVEKLLSADVCAADEVDAQRALSRANARFWSQLEPPKPDAKRWKEVLAQIAGKVQQPTVQHNRRRLWRFSGALASAVAIAGTVLIGLVIVKSQQVSDVSTAPPSRPTITESFAVLAPHEIEIQSIRQADVPLVVVGEPPLRDGVKLMTYSDVKLDVVQADWDGMMPQVQTGSISGMPFIYAPLSRGP
jgi:anti-sigma factor RsiW